MKRVYICSPFRADSKEQFDKNIILVKEMCKKAIDNHCAPFAPHLMYTQFLDDNNPKEREDGKSAGLKFLYVCDELWFSNKYGISEGMREEVLKAIQCGIKIVKI